MEPTFFTQGQLKQFDGGAGMILIMGVASGLNPNPDIVLWQNPGIFGISPFFSNRSSGTVPNGPPTACKI